MRYAVSKKFIEAIEYTVASQPGSMQPARHFQLNQCARVALEDQINVG